MIRYSSYQQCEEDLCPQKKKSLAIEAKANLTQSVRGEWEESSR
jgi:hypothetical protein